MVGGEGGGAEVGEEGVMEEAAKVAEAKEVAATVEAVRVGAVMEEAGKVAVAMAVGEMASRMASTLGSRRGSRCVMVLGAPGSRTHQVAGARRHRHPLHNQMQMGLVREAGW